MFFFNITKNIPLEMSDLKNISVAKILTLQDGEQDDDDEEEEGDIEDDPPHLGVVTIRRL